MNTELLAPGGSFESVIAAYNAGADAVYTGGMMFGARAGADNLTTEQLMEVLDYAHMHGRKLYLTVNTLLKDKEIKDALFDFIAPLYEHGLDAVIVQDMGVFSYIRSQFPNLPIHASTQMTIFGAETARTLKEMGAARIVTPRELSLQEIRAIHDQVDIEIESFVHGALCYCYSGQCFLSSYIGGRSGNRGRCAQPCRMEYDVIKDDHILNPGNQKYVLSPKDICTLQILPQIIQAGVDSLKIEGRMKKVEYIAGVVSIYRKYLDLYQQHPKNYRVDQKDIQKLMDLFHRHGFHESYYQQHNGRNMISLKKPEFRKENRELTQHLKESYTGKTLKRVIDVSVICRANQPLTLSTMVDGQRVEVQGDVPGTAKNKPLDAAALKKQIQKTGNTAFTVGTLQIALDEGLFVPLGAVNELRRQFLEQVAAHILRPFYREGVTKIPYDNHVKIAFVSQPTEDTSSLENGGRSENEIPALKEGVQENIPVHVLVSNMEQLQAAVDCRVTETIYLESTGFVAKQLQKAVDMVKGHHKAVYLAMPYVFRLADQVHFDSRIRPWIADVDGFLIRNVEAYYYLKNLVVAKSFIFDYNVYAGNQIAKSYYASFGAKTTAPLELNAGELKARGVQGDELIVYGYMPAMISAGCGLKTCNACTKENTFYTIRDRRGNCFPTQCVCDDCYNIMYNCKPLSLFKFAEEMKAMQPDAFRLSFTIESGEETKKILVRAEQALTKGISVTEDDRSTRGHFRRGVL